MSLDIDYVREQFPALRGEWVYLDNAGGSQVPQCVADRISDYLLSTNVQLGASYTPSQLAGERVAQGRASVAQLVNAQHVEEMVFGPSTTVLLRFLADAMASQFDRGDEIIVTNTDHESNIGPWLRLRERGVNVRFWNCNPETLELELETLGGLMNERTRLVCVTHVSNLLGTINPVKSIARFVHERGARLCVDGVAYAPHRAIDVADWDVDFYCFSLYKVYGPHLAALFVKRDILLELDNIYHGFFDKKHIPNKMEPGNLNYELTYACGAIVEYLEGLVQQEGTVISGREAIMHAFEAIAEQETRLGEILLAFLRARDNVRIIGLPESDPDRRVPTISFVVNGMQSDDIVRRVDEASIGIRFGDFYARRLVEDMGLTKVNGVVRVSMVHYNTEDEINRLVEILDTVI
ncbi:MAG TPA: cysteine desulfurase-like protein [Modicisalibacter sp.]|nr:cysteine desulfurase-like protein [Modicisalibacter sp.]